MTDLSKQLAEIKRRVAEGYKSPITFPAVPQRLDAEGDIIELGRPESHGHRLSVGTAINDAKYLLHIIEVEIPGKLRADAAAHEHRVEPNESRFAEGLRAAALYIESLSNEKEKG